MSLVDVDSWITEFEGCERLSHDIQTELVLREGESRLSNEYSRISATIRIRLKQFSNELQQLKSKLDQSAKTNTLTSGELERRQRQIENLESKYRQLETKFTDDSRNDREALFASSASRLWENDDNDDDVPVLDTNNSTVEDLRNQQIKILEDQNQGLESLSQSISRQKQLATRLGEEVGEHHEILDTLDNNMTRTDTRINAETRQIGAVSRQDSTWGYWLVIIALAVAIIVTAVL